MNNPLEQYIWEHSREEDNLLKSLSRATHLRALNPQMASGHLQGQILEMLSNMIRPERILEIGTFTGYSAICLAKGLKEGGHLHTIEINDELEQITSDYFRKTGLGNTITQHIGNAIDIIPKIDETFDLVFIDGDKRQYCQYFNLVINKVRPGGFILVDNVLWHGKVVNEVVPKDKQTIGVMQFNDKIMKEEGISHVILPIRDGLMIIRKN